MKYQSKYKNPIDYLIKAFSNYIVNYRAEISKEHIKSIRTTIKKLKDIEKAK